MAAFGPDRIDDVKSCSSSLPVPAVKGLVGDARSDPDLTPAAAGKSSCFDRSIKPTAGAHHQYGRVSNHVQLVIGVFDIGPICIDLRRRRRRLDLGQTLRRLDLRPVGCQQMWVEEPQRFRLVVHAKSPGRDRGYSGRAKPGRGPG
jgi:hypothetical protein